MSKEGRRVYEEAKALVARVRAVGLDEEDETYLAAVEIVAREGLETGQLLRAAHDAVGLPDCVEVANADR